MSKYIRVINPPKELRRHASPIEVLATKFLNEPIEITCPFCGNKLCCITFTVRYGMPDSITLECKNCLTEFRGTYNVITLKGGGIVISGLKIEETIRGVRNWKMKR